MKALELPDVPAWWESEAHLLRFVCDLIRGELSVMRRRQTGPPPPWNPSLHLVRDLAIDSLELLSLATAFSEMLHVHRSGIEDYLLARLEIQDWVAVARQSLRTFSSELTFRTSGSAGNPKRCIHQAAVLWQEVAELVPLLPGRRRIFSAVSSQHIYGFLFTVLLPQAPGMGNLDVFDLRPSSPARLVQELREGDLIVGHPEFWRAFLRLQPTIPHGVIGVSSTAPCPSELAQGLQSAGLDKLIQVYGSSETGGVGWRVSADSPFLCFSYWRRVEDEAAVLERTLPDGKHSRFAVQDEIEWIDAHTFRPGGRIDHAVQVGGINVFPAQAAAVLRANPSVLEVSVRMMRADEGNRLKAFIVPMAGYIDLGTLQSQLASWVCERLEPAARPMVFSFGSELPRQSNGKLADWIIETTS